MNSAPFEEFHQSWPTVGEPGGVSLIVVTPVARASLAVT
jgi:hypothetical protein